MQFYSTNNKQLASDLKKAVLQGLAPDKGLYMPQEIRTCEASFIKNISTYEFSEIAFQVAYTLLEGGIEKEVLKKIIYETVSFDAPLVDLDSGIYTQELFHGPSLAFKDFGARFMARLMAHFQQGSNETLHILVATSGDTGGAVALGFLDVPGIEVSILYPSGKVSDYQEMQLTTLGKNISAYEVNGVFDDCQDIVKKAFVDEALRTEVKITSANSINISRLIPQMFYYFWAYAQLKDKSSPIAISVPSGNFGNITAGLIAKRMGLPISRFVASVNANDAFTEYLSKGVFTAKDSIATISNAMDVGNPSNLTRILDLYKNDLDILSSDVSSYSFSDEETRDALRHLSSSYSYIADPHGAVAYLGLMEFLKGHSEYQGIFQITAHPSKFKDVVESATEQKVNIPGRLEMLSNREKVSIEIGPSYAEFKEAFLSKINT